MRSNPSPRPRRPAPSAALTLVALLALPMVGACATASTELGRAREALALGDEAEAERWLRAALADPAAAEGARAQLVALLLARASARRGEDPAAAAAVYAELLRLAPDTTEARLALARMRMRDGDHEGALALLDTEHRCRGCATLAGVVYLERGRAALEAGRFAAAAADLDAAFVRGAGSGALLLKCEAYTRGGHGEAGDAVHALLQALAVIPRDRPGELESWAAMRREVAVKAARSGDISGVEQALVLDDPRTLDGDARMLDDFSLRLAVAQGELEAGFHDDGVRRAAGVFIDARDTARPELLARVRAEMVALFTRRAAALLERGEGREAAEGLAPALRVDPDNHVIRLQQILAIGTYDLRLAQRQLDALPRDTAGRERVSAVLYTLRARVRLTAGQFSAAAADLERARKLDPNGLEVRLARAEYMAATRQGGLTRDAAQAFREEGEFRYPDNRVNRYGEALGQLDFIRARWDDAARADPLRGPGFEDRLETLEANIRSFYPYAVRWRADHKAQLVFDNGGAAPVEVEVARGPRAAEVIEVPPGGQADLLLDAPSYVRVSTPGKRLGLFAEPGVAIVLVTN